MTDEARPGVLLVEDDVATQRAVNASLDGHGYAVRVAADGQEALRLWEMRRPDVVLLDLTLPDMDGLQIIRRLRRDATTPILVLSARDQERDKVDALEQGADDFVTKPFGMAELHARLRALLRRAAGPGADESGMVEIGPLRLDVAAHQVTVSGIRVALTPREFELLKVLLSHAGRIVTRGRLLRAVWGSAYGAEAHYVHVYVSQIRRKLAAADRDSALQGLIVSEPGIGYRIVPPD
jgi:two-component system KDP operon response regulator KdpE